MGEPSGVVGWLVALLVVERSGEEGRLRGGVSAEGRMLAERGLVASLRRHL